MNDRAFDLLLARRARHRSRSVAVGVALAVVVLAALAVALLAAAPLTGLRLPVTLASVLSGLRDAPVIAFSAAAGAGVLGLLALVAAVTPGRRSRHRLADDRAVVIVDDDVLAGAVSGRAARLAGVAAGQVSTELGARSLTTRMRPTTGHPLDEDRLAGSVADYAQGLGPHPALRTRVRVDAAGVIGA